MPKRTAPKHGPEPGEERGTAVQEQLERSMAIEQLLIAGVSRSRISTLMAQRYGLTDGQVRGHMERIKARWISEEKENRAMYKETAMRRLYGHIAEAKKAGNWASVAQLERLLAEMQGTREPVEVAVNVGSTVVEAAAHVLSGLTPEKIAALVSEQRRLLALAEGKPVIETTAEPVEEHARDK